MSVVMTSNLTWNKVRMASTAILLCGSVLLWAGEVAAQSDGGVVSQRNHVSPESVERFWTTRRLQEATPAPMGEYDMRELGEPVLPEADERARSSPPGLPETRPEIDRTPRPQGRQRQGQPDDGAQSMPVPQAEPEMISQQGYPFTTRRVTPIRTPWTYPYRLAGRLFYQTPDGLGRACSAAIINRRVVLTAAHCLWDRDEGEFNQNFLFIPAYNGAIENSEPYCRWSWDYVAVTNYWINNPGYPNQDDFGALVMSDTRCAGELRSIGDYLGWFGWTTRNLIGNNITQLGYPGNLDNGQRMQFTQSDVYRRTDYAGEIGSAQWRGTSGGPWVQNFGRRPQGQVGIGDPRDRGMNRIVGVSSYGRGGNLSNHNQWQYGGASVLNSRFINVFEAACEQAPGNCAD